VQSVHARFVILYTLVLLRPTSHKFNDGDDNDIRARNPLIVDTQRLDET